ncbi:unnamed protein product [Paramecium sonneborni]|uniref:Uncharacterized protein n=1 Tax=Paramecium sonneborni TaxID=65129 RepID=A0A8S1RUD6_9CILI|nr:unnamed protein product [Paramecium sonneborni]
MLIIFSNCIQNGNHCIEKLNCHENQQQLECIQDKQERASNYYQGKCYSKSCDQAPDIVRSIILRQLFENEIEECVPKKNGGFKNKPIFCNQLETQDACQTINYLSDIYIWNQTQQFVKQKNVLVPLQLLIIQFKNWLNDYECISILEVGCVDNFDNCNKIKNLKSYECFEEECLSLNFPKYDTDLKCSERMNICKFNYQTQSCINTECQNFSELKCDQDFQMNKFLISRGCIHKRCESASLLYNSYEDCQNWDIRLSNKSKDAQLNILNVVNFLINNNLHHKQDIPCFWNIQTKECEFQTCQNVLLLFTSREQFQEWLKYHNQKCLNKQRGRGIEQFASCQKLSDELQ